MDASDDLDDIPAEGAEPSSPGRTAVRIAIRLVVVVFALTISGFVLFGIFDELDFDEIRSALGRLSDAEWLALGFGWLGWVGAQGLQTASLVRGLPARRGVLASLGPTAVSSVIPGPSDLPVRFTMYQSWGVSKEEAGTAVAASGIFSIGSQLALPALAGIAIFFADVPVDGFLSVIVVSTLILAVAVVVSIFVLGSSDRTAAMGRFLDPLWQRVLRVLRKPERAASLGDFLVDVRRQAFDHLDGKWLPTSAATVLTLATKCSLLVMTLRFVGIPEADLRWTAIFVVFALVAGLTIVPITPGSVGVAEVALVGMLTPIAGTEYVNEIAAGVLLYRLLTWLLIIPVGFLVLGVWRLGTQRTKAAATAAA